MATFVDTNVLVYAVDRSDPEKRAMAHDALAEVWQHAVFSAQVLDEYFVTITRKIPQPLSPDDAHASVRLLLREKVIPIDADLVDSAIGVTQRAMVSLWDALVIAAAKRGGCDVLLSEDLNHGQVIEGVRIHNPFLI